MTSFEHILKQYDYPFRKELIAQQPAVPKDAAQLLIYNSQTQQTHYDVFAHIGRYLPKGAVLVFNETRVVPARLEIVKPTGGKAELLYLETRRSLLKVLSNRKLSLGAVLILKTASRRNAIHTLKVRAHEGQGYLVQPSFKTKDIVKILNTYGKTPLPPYIRHSTLTEKKKREKYQSIFARQGLSVAAPTASLHFTKRLIRKLKKQGVTVAFVTLHVGLGTFAALRAEQWQSGTLHFEQYEVSKSTARILNAAKKQKRPVIAVGTTVVRTLESATIGKTLKAKRGDTNLFIREGYAFKFVDGMVTNFHVPRSSLLMLVAAKIGKSKLFELYARAQEKKFKFFSFGDGMLIL